LTNLKEENKKLNNNIKEGTEKFLDEEKQQIENITSTISEITEQVTENINEYQEKNKEILEEGIDRANKYQQESINTIQSFSNNYIELQKNLLNTFHSVVSKFLDVALDNSYWNNFIYPRRYTDIYNKTNQNIKDNTLNATRRLNEFVLGSTETFDKLIEIAQKYYNDSIQNYFNFVNKIGKSFSNQ
jgi:F0F1-type ATP synthase membrane subunit b/b'